MSSMTKTDQIFFEDGGSRSFQSMTPMQAGAGVAIWHHILRQLLKPESPADFAAQATIEINQWQ